MAYVYTYSHDDGIIRYVGKGNDDRDLVHLTKCKNKRFRNWLALHPNPMITRVAEHLSEDAAYQLEEELIAKIGRQGYESGGTLLNHATGGRGGTKGAKLSAETRLKMKEERSMRTSPEYLASLGRGSKTHWATAEGRAQRIQSLKAAQTRPETLAKRVKPCTIDGGKTIFPSRKSMIAALGQGKLGAGSPKFQYV